MSCSTARSNSIRSSSSPQTKRIPMPGSSPLRRAADHLAVELEGGVAPRHREPEDEARAVGQRLPGLDEGAALGDVLGVVGEEAVELPVVDLELDGGATVPAILDHGRRMLAPRPRRPIGSVRRTRPPVIPRAIALALALAPPPPAPSPRPARCCCWARWAGCCRCSTSPATSWARSGPGSASRWGRRSAGGPPRRSGSAGRGHRRWPALAAALASTALLALLFLAVAVRAALGPCRALDGAAFFPVLALPSAWLAAALSVALAWPGRRRRLVAGAALALLASLGRHPVGGLARAGRLRARPPARGLAWPALRRGPPARRPPPALPGRDGGAGGRGGRRDDPGGGGAAGPGGSAGRAALAAGAGRGRLRRAPPPAPRPRARRRPRGHRRGAGRPPRRADLLADLPRRVEGAGHRGAGRRLRVPRRRRRRRARAWRRRRG